MYTSNRDRFTLPSFLAGFLLAIPLAALCAAAQQPMAGQSLTSRPTEQPQAQHPSNTTNQPAGGYVLGPDDQIVIRALNAEEISDKPFLIGTDGEISLPIVGRMRAAGLTVEQFEAAVATRLKTYIRDPEVSVNVVEFRSQPVSVMGAVGTPGVVQLRGRKTLFEVISAAGGLKNEAGNSIKITRRQEFGAIPLPSDTLDPSGQFNIADVSVKSVMQARNPQENIEVKPYDVISVPTADLVYVVGAVKRAGGFVLSERDHMTVLQALSMAEGLDTAASAKNSRIIRSTGDGSDRAEIPVDLNKILTGKGEDVALQANDILFVPNKNAAFRGIGSAIQSATGVAIWRF